MTTSAVTSWELDRNSIIKSALRKLGVLAQGQTPSTEDYTNGTEALNSLIQTLSTEGMPLWKRTTVQITPVAGTASYTVSNVWKIAQVILGNNNSGVQIEMMPKSYYDYKRLPDDTTGTPTNYAYSPGIENGTLYVWPTPDSGTATNNTIDVVYQKEFFSFNTSTDTPDFPAYWTDALIYGLAVRLAPEYGIPLQDRQMLMREYEQYKNAAEGYGDEDGGLFFSPLRMR